MHPFFLPDTGAKMTSVDTFSASRTCRHVGYGNIVTVGNDIGSMIQSHQLKIMTAAIAATAKRIYFVAGHVKRQMYKASFVCFSQYIFCFF
jgi:hypothetical protein